MRIYGRAAVIGCLTLIAGCAATPPKTAPVPTALFMDIVATPQWRAEHEVYALWSGHEVKLPAWIRWQGAHGVSTHAVYCDNGKVNASYGSIRMVIAARPEARMTADSRSTKPQAAARRQAAITYWAFGPLGPANEAPEWTDPSPAQLKARLSSGEVQELTLVVP